MKKDIEVEPWFDLGKPSYDPKDIALRIGATSDAKEQFGGKFPSHIDAQPGKQKPPVPSFAGKLISSPHRSICDAFDLPSTSPNVH